MKRLLLTLTLLLPALAFADTTPPTLFHCSDDSVDIKACAQANLKKAEADKAALPAYAFNSGLYFYQGLDALQKRGVTLDRKTKTLSAEDALFRSRLGEWLYFTTAAFIYEGKKPDDYAGIELSAFAKAEAYPQKDGSYVIFYWDYNGPANVAYQAVRLQKEGTVTPLAAEAFQKKGKPLTVDAIGFFNYFKFNPATNALTSTTYDSATSGDNAQYFLDGDMFHLLQLEHVVLGDHHKKKTTLLYKRTR